VPIYYHSIVAIYHPWFQQSEETCEQAKQTVKRAANGEFERQDLTVSGADRETFLAFPSAPQPTTKETCSCWFLKDAM